MFRPHAKKLLSVLLLSTFSLSVHAVTSAALDGTLLFNHKQNFGHRILHAFDLPYAKLTGIGPTFASEKVTAPINDNLAAIARAGYTDIQISPPSLSTPSTHMLPGPIDPKKLQPQVYQGLKQGAPVPAIPVPSKSYNAWEFAYQPLLCVLDSTYQAELDAVFGKHTDGSSKKHVSQYGVTVNGKVVGYRLGCDRYGSMADLVTLINNAKAMGLNIIADGVFNHTSGYNTNYSGADAEDNYTKFHPFTYVPQDGSTPATYTWDKSVDLTDFYTPFREFEDQPDSIKFAPDSWVFGPDLAVDNPDVQKMIVGYMQLLSDVGLCGMRFDLLYGLGPDATRSIMTKAKAAGMFPPPYSFGYAELDQPLEDLARYGALMPAHDHPLHFSLTKCLTLKPDGWGELDQTELPSVSTLIAPKGLGNFTSATFSVNHDQYPQVSTGTANLRGFYSESKDPENVADTILSQLSMVYLCAKRDGNPHILRFEDERDHKKLIQRSLAFRVLMERQTAPHEYIVDLGHDVLLIARQYGFVLINRGKQAHNVTGDNLQSLVKANNNFAAYLPGLNSTEGVVYDELSGLGSTIQTYNSSQS
ncbi:alpha-amylase family glycosyl hydrolase [Candidatus Finniella inopinata]|uniref:Glycosyl hydrolase family 13 catalytic domain-containing protein n=1 Tax=Candidatus Finniella inopinata TaxID=1696036 RepID=A0A4Q7DIY6_9PROT|nr:alpha-amylase family glycosyl hydrolase [Candidatus Finniella inopinata]RZI46189.1 hypothetical protein EQU50_04435 [Candidatus Finniella inopinata]